jgi:hypothetical protein
MKEIKTYLHDRNLLIVDEIEDENNFIFEFKISKVQFYLVFKKYTNLIVVLENLENDFIKAHYFTENKEVLNFLDIYK